MQNTLNEIKPALDILLSDLNVKENKCNCGCRGYPLLHCFLDQREY